MLPAEWLNFQTCFGMENPSKNEQSKGFWRANSAGAHWGFFVGTWVEWKSPSSMG